MNHSYRLVFDSARGTWIAVHENTHACAKGAGHCGRRGAFARQRPGAGARPGDGLRGLWARGAIALAIGLLAATAPPAFADGGASDGLGGTDSVDGAGGIGDLGGGGGAGATGGRGGSGFGIGIGGAGGQTPGEAGGPGESQFGGGGGGGGAHGQVASSPGDIAGVGGAGGAGGEAVGAGYSGGGGGAGGYGVAVTVPGNFTSSGNIAAGNGGEGGGGGDDFGGGHGGNGGSGGVGVAFGTSGAMLTNAHTITGGNGGTGGSTPSAFTGSGGGGGAGISGSSLTITNNGAIAGGNGAAAGTPGPPPDPGEGLAGSGGAGIVGSNLAITNNGTISGGSNGPGSTAPQPNAITFTGGVNTLTLGSGSAIHGNIDVEGSLDLGNSTPVGLSNIITGAGQVSKSGAGTLTLSGTNTYSGGTIVRAGEVQTGNPLGLGTGFVTLGGGQLTTTATMTLGNGVAFAANQANTVAAATGTTLTLGGLVFLGPDSEARFGTSGAAGTISLLPGGFTDSTAHIHVVGGTLSSGPGSPTANARDTTVDAGAVLDYGTDSAAITDLLGMGTVRSGSNPGSVLQVFQGDFGGTITGNATLVKLTGSFSNTLILSGANSYTGGTTIAGGTLQVGKGGATGTLGSGNITIDNGASLAFNRTGTITVSGDISTSSTGHLRQQGAGTVVLTGTNSYADTFIDAGVLQVGDGGALGTLGTGAVANNGSLVFNRAGIFAVANAIGGSGSVTQAGSGTLMLTGSNTYSGGTSIATGEVQIDNGQALGTGEVILNGGKLTATATLALANGVSFAAGATSTLAAAAGTTLTVNGPTNFDASSVALFGTAGTASTIALSGGAATSDTARIHVLGGTLAGTTLGGITANIASVTVDAGATLDYGGNFGNIGNLLGAGTVQTGTDPAVSLIVRSATFSGDITGSGRLWIPAGGDATLSGPNTYTGGTLVSNTGTLRIGDGGAGGTLGAGSVSNDGFLVFNRDDTHTVANAISGSGSVTQEGIGTTILTGNNTYQGMTTISAGVLQVGDGGTLGSGNVANNASLVFNRSGTLTVANAISGSGTVTQAGAGLTVLAGNNSYGGATLLSGGVLQVGAGGLDGTLGLGTVTNNASLVFDRASTLTVGNAIDGSGSVTQAGPGTTVLTGSNSYGGTTTISAGTLQVGAGGTAGSLGTGAVTNNAALVFDRSDAVTVANAIGGSGNVTQAGTGTTVLTGNNGYGGSTSISSGTLQVGNGGVTGSLGAGAVTNNGTLVFNRSDAATLPNVVSGTGSFTQAGTGTTILTGDNGYGGVTTISAGTLQVGAGGATGTLGTGAVTDNGTLSLNRSGTLTLANAIAGSGSLVQAGPGTTVLTGDNSYTGGTTISAGTLQIGNGGTAGNLAAGAVTNNGALAFQRSDVVTVANSITGSGSFTQAGSGNLILTGANSYSGGTFVNAGTLSVNGSIVGNTTVNSGGTLGGSGTVGGIAVAAGGTLAPGNSIGTLNANGNLSFAAGATYRVEANAAGAADRVNTVGAGTITINGGTVDVRAGGGGYQRNTQYTILSSGGATTGQFADATTNLAFLTPTLVYQANAVLLNLQASDTLSYASVATTPNQLAVASYLGGFANAPTNATAAALIQQIDNLTADQAAATFSSMAGSVHASASQVASALGRNFSAGLAARTGFSSAGFASSGLAGPQYASMNAALYDPVVTSDVQLAQAGPARGVETPLASAQERGFWAQVLGSGGDLDTDGNAAGSRYRSSGFVLGYDQPVSGQWLAGGALGYNRSNWNATSGTAASGKLESPQAGVYARYAGDTWRLRLDATYADHDFSTDRTVAVGSTSSVANSTHRGKEWGMAAQVEYPLQVGEWQLRPLAGLRYAHLAEDGFTETGAGGASLTVADRTLQNTLFSAGMHFVRLFNQGKGGLELRAVASHLAGDNDSPVTASIAGQAGSFTANGVPLKRDALTLGTTLSGQLTRGVSAYVDANYEIRGSGQNAYQATAGVRVSF